MTWLHQRTVYSLAYAEEAEQAEGQANWDTWLAWVTTPPEDYADFVRHTTTDTTALPPAMPPDWSQTEAAAAAAYMEARARG